MRCDKVNILLVDDQPAKLLSYEAILAGLGENLLKATSAREALEHLLKTEIAVILVDVCMPELDGFELAALIREHPRFRETAIIFVSAIHLGDVDRLRGYEIGAVDYVPVPVIPEVLRAKVRVFVELYRKTKQLEELNGQLEKRVTERTAQLEAAAARLLQSEKLRSLALAAGQMGSWEWDLASGTCIWDHGQYRIFGVDPTSFLPTAENVGALIHPEDRREVEGALRRLAEGAQSHQAEFRVCRPGGDVRWCVGTVATSVDGAGRVIRMSGVTVDITDRKEAEERQTLLTREVDHRARNAIAVVQSIVHLTRAETIKAYVAAVEGRIKALSRAYNLLSRSRWQGASIAGLVEDELAPYRTADAERIATLGPDALLAPATAQILALTLHELATNAVKYGALSSPSGKLRLTWEWQGRALVLCWTETDGPPVEPPSSNGYGTKVIVASIERQLGGRVVFDWLPSGLACTVTIPEAGGAGTAERAAFGRRNDSERLLTGPVPVSVGGRILLVEDEAMVAMMMSDALREQGFTVVGPFATAGEAMAALRDASVDAALLDVNLGGEPAYPIADLLLHRRTPFVFLTGYGAEGVDPNYAQFPVLQKPIERHVLERIFSPVGNPRRTALTGCK